MLEPTARHLFTDGLRPPPGFAVDVAVGTTYCLGLGSLLLPPLAMAAHDRESEMAAHDRESEIEARDRENEENDEGAGDTGIALLEAVRRFADTMTVFCQAGAIHVPSSYRRILTFAEDSVVEVSPATPGRIFHPKLWALRFTDGHTLRHRLLVLSRNLTADTSWDTVVQLEETDHERGIDGGPAASFLRGLPALAPRLASGRAGQVADLADSVAKVRFAVPEPFTSGELWPLGVGTGHGWPVPDRVRNAVVISPFLDRSTVRRVRADGRRVFVSRPDTYDDLGADAFTGADVRVLDPLAETTPEEDKQGAVTAPWEVRNGLHAKVMAWDHDGQGWLLTGSANATGAAFGGNVEFGVLLRGPQHRCGVDVLLPAETDSREPTLARVLVPYPITSPEPTQDPARAAEQEVAAYHAALVASGPRLEVTPGQDDQRYDAALTFASAPPRSPGRTTVRLLSRAGEQHARDLGEAAVWRDLPVSEITPFLALRTVVAVEGAERPLTVECVVKAELLGDPEDRAARLLRSLLDSEESVLRYLSFLLDDSGDVWGLPGGGGGVPNGGPARPRFEDLALLETLLRAAARGDESLRRVHALLRDLTDGEGRSPVVSEDFFAVWDAVWAAVGREEPA